jgi:NAD(P)-dependent dehydrogenase (short-subunit alcohol dehydrogenase family)
MVRFDEAPTTILFPDEPRDAVLRNVISTTPLKKAGRPEDIAEMVLFLATQADFVTGQVFVVDGGNQFRNATSRHVSGSQT